MAESPLRRLLRNPVRLVPLGFLVVIAIGTVLLMLPAARAAPGSAGLVTALFTATSAVCVTGLIVVDTPSYWSLFGEGVILGLFQVGGFGILTAATLLTLVLQRRLGLSNRMVAQVEAEEVGLRTDVHGLLIRIGGTVLVCEGLLIAILTTRLWTRYDYRFGDALWNGAFQGVSAFNNTGFSTYSDSLAGFASDWWMIVPMLVAIIVGGIGFPVLLELRRHAHRPDRWSTHTRITVVGTGVLLAAGFAAVLALEWANPRTLGQFGVADKLLSAGFQSATARTAGFTTVDTAALHAETWRVLEVLMFIGGGRAGTAGGIKVTTFVLLVFTVWSGIRRARQVRVGGHRVSGPTVRQALMVASLGLALVASGTISLLILTDEPLERVLFESVSAFGTVGLSTGVTGELPAAGQLVLVVLMFVGRVGVLTVASALALGTSHLYGYPEERPIVG